MNDSLSFHSGRFKPGNKFGTGRPPKSKNQIENIRRRILFIVRKRIMKEKDLQTVSTTDLLKFMAAVMPKDWVQIHAPQVNYISSIPREEESVEVLPIDTEVLPLPEGTVEQQPKQLSTEVPQL